jgi:hypothetical protein
LLSWIRSFSEVLLLVNGCDGEEEEDCWKVGVVVADADKDEGVEEEEEEEFCWCCSHVADALLKLVVVDVVEAVMEVASVAVAVVDGVVDAEGRGKNDSCCGCSCCCCCGSGEDGCCCDGCW